MKEEKQRERIELNRIDNSSTDLKFGVEFNEYTQLTLLLMEARKAGIQHNSNHLKK